MDLENKILAILFYYGEEISLKKIAKILNLKEKEIEEGLIKLKEKIAQLPFVIIEQDKKILLTLRGEYDETIKELKNKEELSPLSVPALETLSIILYNKEISKIKIDEIRGVNSSHILRNLLIRGLIEKKNSGNEILYQPTFDLLRYLGISKIEELPGYQNVKTKLLEIEEDLRRKNDEGK